MHLPGPHLPAALQRAPRAGATVVAWRRLQVNTEHQLARLYQALGMGEAAERMQADAKVGLVWRGCRGGDGRPAVSKRLRALGICPSAGRSRPGK